MIDVLNLEWCSLPSRDREMATLVCNYLRHMGLQVVEECIFDGYRLIDKLKPKLLFIVDTRGAGINFEMMKYSSSKNIKGFTLMAEGNFREGEEFVDNFLWGWNTDKIQYEDINMHWSRRTLEISLTYYPELQGKLRVSGGVGFDLYKIAGRPDRTSLLRKYGKERFGKVIGVGCWDFGILDPQDHRYKYIERIYSPAVINRFIEDGARFNETLGEAIREHPDTLFLLKEHPGVLGGRIASAIEGLEKFENTLLLKNEEGIGKCIAISDFWLVYESTTALEAWLLGTQTCLVNPTGTDFPRDDLYRGSPNYPDIASLTHAIGEFYSRGQLPGFSQLEGERKSLITKVIQWDDGLNHVRAGNEIIDLLSRGPSARKSNDQAMASLAASLNITLAKYRHAIRRFRYYAGKINSFDHEQLKSQQESRMKEQLNYYAKLGLDKTALANVRGA